MPYQKKKSLKKTKPLENLKGWVSVMPWRNTHSLYSWRRWVPAGRRVSRRNYSMLPSDNTVACWVKTKRGCGCWVNSSSAEVCLALLFASPRTHPASTVTRYHCSFMEMLGNQTQARLAELLIAAAFLAYAGTVALTSAPTAQRRGRVSPLVPAHQLGRCRRAPGAGAVFSTAAREGGDRRSRQTEGWEEGDRCRKIAERRSRN